MATKDFTLKPRPAVPHAHKISMDDLERLLDSDSIWRWKLYTCGNLEGDMDKSLHIAVGKEIGRVQVRDSNNTRETRFEGDLQEAVEFYNSLE